MGFDETRKQPRLSKKYVYEKLRDSLFINSKEEIETKGLEQLIRTTDNPTDATDLVKKLDKLTKYSKNNVLVLTGQQEKVFQKFKSNNKFVSAVMEVSISKTTINFKIDIVKFIENYPKMKKSCISLFNLKNNFRVIKKVCQEHASEFQ